MTALAGELGLRISLAGIDRPTAKIVAHRPQVSRLLLNKQAEQVIHLVPMLFNLCAKAQGVAANAAIMTARGESVTSAAVQKWQLSVIAEAASEHLWRLLLDWPQICGKAPVQSVFVEARRACLNAQSVEQLQHALIPAMHELLAMKPKQWLAMTSIEMHNWRMTSSALVAHLMKSACEVVCSTNVALSALPTIQATNWLNQEAELAQAEFSLSPHWQGSACETGAITRVLQHAFVADLLREGRYVAARLMAKVVELAHWSSGMIGDSKAWIDSAKTETGVALARVETARGTLLHRVKLLENQVVEYNIIAPTEWNFHPQGAFTQEIACMLGLSQRALLQQAEMLVLSLDPCVDYQLEWHDA